MKSILTFRFPCSNSSIFFWRKLYCGYFVTIVWRLAVAITYFSLLLFNVKLQTATTSFSSALLSSKQSHGPTLISTSRKLKNWISANLFESFFEGLHYLLIFQICQPEVLPACFYMLFDYKTYSIKLSKYSPLAHVIITSQFNMFPMISIVFFCL